MVVCDQREQTRGSRPEGADQREQTRGSRPEGADQREIEYSKEFWRAYKKGKFYYTCGNDSKILNYLLGYKIKDNGESGFPDVALNKVTSRLEDNKISYKLLFKDHEPLIRSFKDFNRYKVVLEKAIVNNSYNNRINNIIDKINNIEDKDKLDTILLQVERVLNGI